MLLELILGLSAIVVLLALRVPIYIVLMGVPSVLLLSHGESLAGLGQKALSILEHPAMIAVPFFILAAEFMRGGGIARILFQGALAWVGWIRGGLAIAGVAATSIFAAITGSSAATTLTMGSLLVPLMEEKGYKPAFAMGLTTAAGTLGILIPPSLPMILIGLISETSIPRLFLAGLVPGLVQASLFALYIFFMADRVGGKAEPWVGPRKFVRHNALALPAYLIPVAVFVGIYGGVVSLTEAAVLSAVVALVVLIFYRMIKLDGSAPLSQVPKLTTSAVDRTSMIILIIIGATLVSHWLILTKVPQEFAQTVVESNIKPWQFLLIINAALLVLGMFLEGVAIILIVLPVVMSVVKAMGIEMEHFAVLMIINIELALLSPPIGLNLFVMSNVTGRPVGQVLRGTVPFFIIMLVLLMLVTFIPALSTWLPNQFYG